MIALSREFLLAVCKYAANRQGIGLGQNKVRSGYQVAQNASFTGVPALVAGDWNSTMNETFYDAEFYDLAKANQLSMAGLALQDKISTGM